MMNDFNIPIPPRKNKWDIYFHKICEAVASNSPCLSRKVGAILVYDNSVISTGYNGPARGIPHCGEDRYSLDDILRMPMAAQNAIKTICPRHLMGYEQGEGMDLCIAQHAEENCISNAARHGVRTFPSVLYMNSSIPCKNCFSTLINAGVQEIVVLTLTPYDDYSKYIIDQSDIHIREFEL